MNSAVADTLSTLMIITTVALVLPAALYSTFAAKPGSGKELGRMVLSFSRATAVVLLGVYAAYLYFQLKTHSSIFVDEAEDGEGELNLYEDRSQPVLSQSQAVTEQDDQSDKPTKKEVSIAALILVVSGVIIAKCTANFMDSLDGTSETLSVSKTFLAIIIMPLASNATEMAQVVAASRKQKINFAIGVIIGSILQISLFVLPLLVVLGWIMNRPVDLYFEPSQTYILLLAVIVVNQVLQDKHYTFLHGALLISV